MWKVRTTASDGKSSGELKSEHGDQQTPMMTKTHAFAQWDNYAVEYIK